MVSNRSTHETPSFWLSLAEQLLALELFWPFPLLAVGVLGFSDPLLVGAAIFLTLIPWPARWLVLGRPTRRAFVGGALGLMLVGGGVGQWASYDPWLGWPLLLTLLASVSLFFAIVNTAVSRWHIASGLVIVAALAAFYFVGQYGYFDYPTEVGRVADLARMIGSLLPDLAVFTPHPNAIAAFLEGAFLLSLVLTRRARGGMKFTWGLALVFIAYGVFISQSRGSWVGLAVAIGIWVLLLIPNRGLRLAVGGVWLAVALVGAYVVVQRVRPDGGVFVLSSALEAAGGRLTLYRNSFNLLGDYPFTGVGLGDAFAMVYSRYQLLIPYAFLTYSHNLFLSLGLGQGVLGLVALVWLLVSFYAFVIRVELAGLSQHSLPLFRAAWLGATVSWVHGLTDSPQFSDSHWTMPMLFALLGLAVAVGRPALLRAGVQGWGRWVKIGLGAGLAVALAVGVALNLSWLTSTWQANLGAIYQTRADLAPDLDEPAQETMLAQAVTHFERALSLNPDQPVANRRLGMIASDQREFDQAVAYLEQAYARQPKNQATLKALGLAYTWTGQLDRAEELLVQVDRLEEVVGELGTWSYWWGTQDREDLSAYADEMFNRLSKGQDAVDTE